MIVAEQVMTELDLARVVFVPGGIPPHKEASSVRATAPDRLAMVEAAVEGNEHFSVDKVEIDAGRPMHSVETVSILKESSPEDDWYFITGADEVSNLLTWKEPDRLLEQVVMVAATRPGYDLSRLDHLEAALRNFDRIFPRSEEHTSELQSRQYLVCRLLLEKKQHTIRTKRGRAALAAAPDLPAQTGRRRPPHGRGLNTERCYRRYRSGVPLPSMSGSTQSTQ